MTRRSQATAKPTTRLEQRPIRLRAESFDAESSSVEAVIATDLPTRIWDHSRGRVVEEILVSGGGEFPRSIPLLDSHDLNSVASVLGSAQDIRQNDDGTTTARLSFASDDASQTAAAKVRDGHITDVSIGYTVTRSETIAAGRTKAVDGRQYTASEDTDLRVSTNWRAAEVSVTSIGADSAAKIRSNHEGVKPMNERLRAYLESLGLSPEATDNDEKMTATQRAISAALETDGDDTDQIVRSLGYDPANPVQKLLPVTPAEEPQEARSEPQPEADESTAEALRAAGAADERARRGKIRDLGQGVPAEIVERAIDSGETPEQATSRFLEAIRNRPEGVPMAPAQHSVDREIDFRTLEMAGMWREGVNPVDTRARFDLNTGCIIPTSGEATDEEKRCADKARRLSDISLVDLLARSAELCGIRNARQMGRQELMGSIRTSQVSLTPLMGIFTNIFGSQLVAAYEAALDTTAAFTYEADAPNFLEADRPRMLLSSGLTGHPAGGTAKDIQQSDQTEKVKVDRFSGRFVVDEQDIYNDQFGALTQQTPANMGSAAAQLRAQLVYWVLLTNPAMSDGRDFYNATDGNLLTGTALSNDNIKTALTALNTFTENGRLIGKADGYVIVTPEALDYTATQALSPTISNDSGAGSSNPLAGRGLTVTSDGHLDVGVMHPYTGGTTAGQPDNWYVARRGMYAPIEVTFLRGTGRAPEIRSGMSQPGSGQWFMQWDVKHDITATAIRRFSMVKCEA